MTGVVTCALTDCPLYNGAQVYLQQCRGIFSSPIAETSSVNMAIYGNDNFQLNRYVTLNVGLRWDEEQLNAVTQSYVFNDNWSPRLGINIDPFGDRKSKIFFNWGRYTQSFPQDGALRDLSNELDIYTVNWKPEADANNNVVIGSWHGGSGPRCSSPDQWRPGSRQAGNQRFHQWWSLTHLYRSAHQDELRRGICIRSRTAVRWL